MPLTRDDVIRILGPADDQTIAQVIASGATLEELAEARAWIVNDEPLLNTGRPMATGRVSQLVETLERLEEELSGADER